MTSSAPRLHSHVELSALIEKVFHQANAPLDIAQIRSALPVSFRLDEQTIQQATEQLVHEHKVFVWKPRSRSKRIRYWNVSDSTFSKEIVRSFIQDRPISENELLKKARSHLFALPVRETALLVKSSLKALTSEGSLFIHPPRQARHRVRYAAIPVDPAPYMHKLRAEFARVMKVLRHSGVTAADVLNRLGGNAAQASFQPAQIDIRNEPRALHDGEDEAEAPISRLADELMDTIYNRIPGAKNSVPIWLPDLRRYSPLSKSHFDRVILYLARNGKLHLDRHTHPGSLTDETRESFVQDEAGVSYVAAALM